MLHSRNESIDEYTKVNDRMININFTPLLAQSKKHHTWIHMFSLHPNYKNVIKLVVQEYSYMGHEAIFVCM